MRTSIADVFALGKMFSDVCGKTERYALCAEMLIYISLKGRR